MQSLVGHSRSLSIKAGRGNQIWNDGTLFVSLGGSSSNIYTALLGGNVDLSVIMTFVSTTLSFGTFPMWIWLFGGNYIDFNRTKFPWWSMFLSLMTVFLPAVVGFLFRRYRPVLAYRIGRFLNPIAVGKYENPAFDSSIDLSLFF